MSAATATLIAGGLAIVGALLGAVVGLFGERLVRRWLGELECKIVGNWIQQGGYSPDGSAVKERRLEILFVNRKELPVTVTDITVTFYTGREPLEDGAQPQMTYVGADETMSPPDLVNIPAYTGVKRTLSLTPKPTAYSAQEQEKLRELAKSDRAVLKAEVVGAEDITLELEKAWSAVR